MSKGSWDITLSEAYASLEADYQRFLEEDEDYFPSKENYFNAFKTLPEDKVKYRRVFESCLKTFWL